MTPGGVPTSFWLKPQWGVRGILFFLTAVLAARESSSDLGRDTTAAAVTTRAVYLERPGGPMAPGSSRGVDPVRYGRAPRSLRKKRSYNLSRRIGRMVAIRWNRCRESSLGRPKGVCDRRTVAVAPKGHPLLTLATTAGGWGGLGRLNPRCASGYGDGCQRWCPAREGAIRKGGGGRRYMGHLAWHFWSSLP